MSPDAKAAQTSVSSCRICSIVYGAIYSLIGWSMIDYSDLQKASFDMELLLIYLTFFENHNFSDTSIKSNVSAFA